MLKKANAVVGILTTLCFVWHALEMGLLLIGWIGYRPSLKISAHLLVVCVCVHILFAMLLMFFNKSDSGKLYGVWSKETIVQRLSAIALLFMLAYHVFENIIGSQSAPGQTIEFAAFESAFVVVGVLHVAASFARALVTLGLVGSERSFRLAKGIAWAMVGFVGCFSIAGVLIYVFAG